MVVLMPCKWQAEALDRIGDEAGRAVMLSCGSNASSIDGRSCPPRLLISAASSASDQCSMRRVADALIADLVEQSLAPSRATLEGQRGIQLVRARSIQSRSRSPPGSANAACCRSAVFQNDDVPAEVAEDRLEACPQALRDNRVQALAVVVDDPPAVSKAVFPTFEKGLKNVALIHLGVADKGDHTAFRPSLPISVHPLART